MSYLKYETNRYVILFPQRDLSFGDDATVEHWQQSSSDAVSDSLDKQSTFLNYCGSRERTPMLSLQRPEWGFAWIQRLAGLLARIAQGTQSAPKKLSGWSLYKLKKGKGVTRCISLGKPLVLHSTAPLFWSQTLPKIEIVWLCCESCSRILIISTCTQCLLPYQKQGF